MMAKAEVSQICAAEADPLSATSLQSVVTDKTVIAIDVLNRSLETQTVQVKPRGVAGKQSAVIPAGASHTFLFPVTEFKKEYTVILSNGKKMQRVTRPVIPVRKSVKSGAVQTTPYGSFRVTALAEGLEFKISVKDDKRGDYEAKPPWEGDGDKDSGECRRHLCRGTDHQ